MGVRSILSIILDTEFKIIRMADYVQKIIIIGDSEVGKTSLLLKFTDDSFSENQITTIGVQFKLFTIKVDEKPVKLQLWDTSGAERFLALTSTFYRGAAGVMLVYDVTREGSFYNIKKWLKRIEDYIPSDVPKIIVAAKSDLEDKRVISKVRGETLAMEYGADFVETSAKTGDKVIDSFYKIAQSVKFKTDQKILQEKINKEGLNDGIEIDPSEPKPTSIFRCGGWNYCSGTYLTSAFAKFW